MPTPPVRSPKAGARWLSSRQVAARLGLETSTLRVWRTKGKGPKGWRRTTPTTVVYPLSAVEEFESTWGVTDAD
jgi:hypothetical protein